MSARLLPVALLVVAAKAAAQTASAPGQVLTTGVDARGLGMGGAYTAAVENAAALYYNPAGLAMLEGRQAMLMHGALYGGASYDYLGYAQNFKNIPGAWGGQLVRLGVGGVEQRDSLNNASGSFGYNETAYGFGAGVRGVFMPRLSVGGGLNILSRQLAGSSDRLIGINVGAQYGPVVSDRLMLGLNVQNALSLSQGDTSDKLPRAFRLGAAYRLFGPLLAVTELNSSGGFVLGTEYSLGRVFLRAGYLPEGMAFGGGVKVRAATFDLAVVNDAQLGVSQRLSMSYRFGAGKPPPRDGMAEQDLEDAKGELQNRDYLRAARDLEAAEGLDAKIPREWKIKGRKLKALVSALDLEKQPELAQSLAGGSEAAALSQRSIHSYLEGREDEAMILAHVATGAGQTDHNLNFMSLLQGMAAVTHRSIVSADVLSPAGFLQERTRRAIAAIYQKQYEAAARECHEALVVRPDDEPTWLRLGSAYFAGGDRARARQAWEQALRLQPENPGLREFMEKRLNEKK